MVKYSKRILKMGDRSTYPSKGDTVECFYTGKLDSGKVFDTNVEDGTHTSADNRYMMMYRNDASNFNAAGIACHRTY